MNRFQTRLATGLATGACAALWALAFAIAPAAFAQESVEAAQHGNPHQAMQAREFRNLRQGRGMGMGRIADVNGYPGPKHVLEHAAALELTDDQIDRSRELMARVKTRAPELGNQVVEAEGRLQAMFAEGGVDPAEMDSLLMEIGKLRAQLRSLHLTAHLDQAELLTETQREKYKALRSDRHADGERRPMRRMRSVELAEPSGG